MWNQYVDDASSKAIQSAYSSVVSMSTIIAAFDTAATVN